MGTWYAKESPWCTKALISHKIIKFTDVCNFAIFLFCVYVCVCVCVCVKQELMCKLMR